MVFIRDDGQGAHLLPTWDIRQHDLNGRCTCGAEVDCRGYASHKAFDGREAYENGERRPH